MSFIIKPLISEKMNNITEKTSVEKTYKPKTGKHRGEEVTKKAQPKYGFIVKPEANKIEIAKEIEGLQRLLRDDEHIGVQNFIRIDLLSLNHLGTLQVTSRQIYIFICTWQN